MSASPGTRLWTDPLLPGITLMSARYRRHSFRPHSHAALTVCSVEQGVCGLEVAGDRRAIDRGRLSLIDAGAVHTGACESDSLRYLGVYLSVAVAERLFGLEPDGPTTVKFVSGAPLSSRLAARFSEAHRACATRSGASQARDLQGVLADILRRWAAPAARGLASRPSEPLVRARQLLEGRYATNVSLDALAREAGMSRFHFLRSFKASFGLPPHSWLIQFRVQRAQALLSGSLPLAEVALAVGFSDQSHFGNHFKGIVGVSPGRYRRWLRERSLTPMIAGDHALAAPDPQPSQPACG